MIRFNKKLSFFDTDAVKKSIDKVTRGAFGRFGAFVRRVSRSSIRDLKRLSNPGEPPRNRTGILRKGIFFGFDPGARSVVIGPIRFSGMSGDIPRVLEEGGTIVEKRSRFGRARKVTKIRPHPYMGPAFDKGQDKLEDFWRQSIKR